MRLKNVLCLAVAGLVFPGLAALADSRETIIAECHAQLQLGDAGCTCIADRAEDELSDRQQAFLIATVTDDDAARGQLVQQMGAFSEGLMGIREVLEKGIGKNGKD